MARGRKEKQIVKIVENEDNSTRLIPSNEKQLQSTGVNTEEDVYVKRTVRHGKKEILLQLSNDKEELQEEK